MEIITEILKTHKLKFPWTTNDLTDLVKHSMTRPAYKNFDISNFENFFKSIGAIEER